MPDTFRVEWDPRKAETNLRKHGIGFEVAMFVFDDPLIYEVEEGDAYGEARYGAVGEVRGRLLFVAYTTYAENGEEVVRLISARKATAQEHRAYYRKA